MKMIYLIYLVKQVNSLPKLKNTYLREKLIDEGDVELGVQRHGYHEYFLEGNKFETKLHFRVFH